MVAVAREPDFWTTLRALGPGWRADSRVRQAVTQDSIPGRCGLERLADHGSATDAFAWHDGRLELAFRHGERPLFRLPVDGLAARPEPFVGEPLSDLRAPRQKLAEAGRGVALIASCPLAEPLRLLALRDGWLRYVPSRYPRYAIDVGAGFDAYVEHLHGRTLSALRHKTGRAAATNRERPLSVRYDTPEAMAEFLELARPISERAYQQRLFGIGLPDDDAFRASVIERAREGRIAGFILFLQDRPAAYTLCPHSGPGVALYDHTGFDPAFEPWSPATVLQLAVIESLCADPAVRVYDLHSGGGRHKALFATREQPCADVWFARPLSLPGVALLAHGALTLVTEAAGRVLDAMRLCGRVRARVGRAA
jgi:hypothetical protein